MNLKKSIYGIVTLAACSMLVLNNPMDSRAETYGGPGIEGGDYVATVDVPSVNVNVSHDSDQVLIQATKGQSFPVLEDMGDGWLKIKVGGSDGYIPLDGNTSISEQDEVAASESEKEIEAAPAPAPTDKRQNLVNYALQFVGGKYRYGGNDPRTGADCSGFTRFVLANGAGVALNRSSTAQSVQGAAVSQDQMKPGDLIFYGKGKKINHVALYIGNGQIVHASTYKTGIKISNWNYRTPIKIINVLGD